MKYVILIALLSGCASIPNKIYFNKETKDGGRVVMEVGALSTSSEYDEPAALRKIASKCGPNYEVIEKGKLHRDFAFPLKYMDFKCR